MRGIRRHFCTRSWLGHGVVSLTALLTLGAGLCLFDGGAHDGHDGDVSWDLCLGMIAASLLIPLLAGPRIDGWVLAEPRQLAYATSPHLPDPPPKPATPF